MGWLQKHITGEPEKVAEFERAHQALEDYRDGDGSANDKEFVRLNEAAHKAAEQVPAAKRAGWW